jgi:hypothetical protein
MWEWILHITRQNQTSQSYSGPVIISRLDWTHFPYRLNVALISVFIYLLPFVFTSLSVWKYNVIYTRTHKNLISEASFLNYSEMAWGESIVSSKATSCVLAFRELPQYNRSAVWLIVRGCSLRVSRLNVDSGGVCFSGPLTVVVEKNVTYETLESLRKWCL